jgi:hypothetical protein
MRNLKFVTCLPSDTYYTWQVHLWLESLKELGHSNKAVVLIFNAKNTVHNIKWDQITDLYPEAIFKFYNDEHNINELLPVYIPVLRPYLMWRFYTDFPEMAEREIFYCDSDVIFTKDFDISHLLEDDVNYLSDTNSYINASYFDSKIHDVLPEKLEQYKSKDILDELCEYVGISREICEKNNFNSGGAQYLLKNVDAKFWRKVMEDCIHIRKYLQWINRIYFESENKGFQSWCADMWAVLWNLWNLNQETKIVPELDFAWSSNPKTILEKYTILHNAGLSGDYYDNGQEKFPVFYKGKYINGSNPFADPHLHEVFMSPISWKYCTHFYTEKLFELQKKYKLTY